MNTKNSLKKFLATASAMAMITGASSSAIGANLTDNNADVSFQDGTVGPFFGGGNFTNGDSFYLTNPGHNLTTTGAITLKSIDLNNQASNGFTFVHDTTVGPISDPSLGTNTLDVIVNDGISLTLVSNTGTDANGGNIQENIMYGLGNVTLGSGGAAGTLIFSTNFSTINGTINSNANAADGVINVIAASTVSFDGKLGGTKAIAEVNISGTGAISYKADTNVTTTKIANDSADVNLFGNKLTGDVLFTSDGDFGILTDGVVDGNIDSTVVGKGRLLLRSGQVTGTIGATNSISDLQVSSDAGGDVIFNKSSKIDETIIYSGGTLDARHSDFVVHSNSIKIGSLGGGTDGTLIVDANADYNLNISPGNAANIIFDTAGSVLKLTNSTGVDRVVTLSKTLATADKGTIEINSEGTNSLNLAVANGATIGTDNANRFLNLKVTGDKSSTIAPGVFAKTITISSSAESSFAGDIDGGANSLIEFSGGAKVNFTGALTAPTTLNFVENTEVVTDNFDLGAANITNVAGKNDNKLTVKVAQNVSGDIATEAEPFGELSMDAGAPANIELNTTKFYAGITGANANVIFNTDGSSASYLGKVGVPINNAEFTQDGKVFGEVHAKTVDVRDNATAVFDHATFNAQMEMHGVNSKAEFTKKIAVDNVIKANGVGQGTLDFQLGAVVNSDIGALGARLAKVDFGGDVDVNADIHSNLINFGNNVVTVNQDTSFDGGSAFDGSTIVLGGNDLRLESALSELMGDVEIKTTVVGVDLGNLIAVVGEIDFAAVNSLKITLDDTAGVPVNGQNLKLIRVENGGTLPNMDLNKITVDSKGAFSDWEKAEVGGELVLTYDAPPVVVPGGNKIGKLAIHPLEDIDPGLVASLGVVEDGSDAHQFASQLHFMDEEHREKAKESLKTTMNEIEKAGFSAASDVTGVVSARLSKLNAFRAFTPGVIGVASGDGDGDDRYGIWATPFYSKIDQKMRGTSSGYKVNSYGGTLGFDFKANDDMVIGAAFSAINSEVKHRDAKFGDRTKVSSYLFSLYSRQQFDQNWFGQGVFSIGSSSSNNKEGRFIANNVKQTAHGKYSSMMFSGEVLGGYTHAINEQVSISPIFGLNYSRINATAYRETGEELTPLQDVEKLASHKLNLVGGVKVRTAPYLLGSVEITPEIHGFIRHDLIGKGARINSVLSGQTKTKEKEPAKLQKTFYNIGTSLDAEYGCMDYGISADVNIAQKYIGLQGSLKARVNF